MSLKELGQDPLLLPPPGTALRRIIDRAAAAADVELQAQAEIDGVRLLASLAFEGYGPAIVPATSVPRWLKGDFHRVPVPELPRRVVGWVQRRRPAPGIPTRVLMACFATSSLCKGPSSPACTSAPRPSPSAALSSLAVHAARRPSQARRRRGARPTFASSTVGRWSGSTSTPARGSARSPSDSSSKIENASRHRSGQGLPACRHHAIQRRRHRRRHSLRCTAGASRRRH